MLEYPVTVNSVSCRSCFMAGPCGMFRWVPRPVTTGVPCATHVLRTCCMLHPSTSLNKVKGLLWTWVLHPWSLLGCYVNERHWNLNQAVKVLELFLIWKNAAQQPRLKRFHLDTRQVVISIPSESRAGASIGLIESGASLQMVLKTLQKWGP